MKDDAEIASGGVKRILRFMETGSGVQAILRFYFRKFRGLNVGITDGKDSWAQVPTKFHLDRLSLSDLFVGDIHTDTPRLRDSFVSLVLILKNKDSGLVWLRIEAGGELLCMR
jgi:hypothetical protein